MEKKFTGAKSLARLGKKPRIFKSCPAGSPRHKMTSYSLRNKKLIYTPHALPDLLKLHSNFSVTRYYLETETKHVLRFMAEPSWGSVCQ